MSYITTRQQFCIDSSTLFQSHCQKRISYLQSNVLQYTINKETGRHDVLDRAVGRSFWLGGRGAETEV